MKPPVPPRPSRASVAFPALDENKIKAREEGEEDEENIGKIPAEEARGDDVEARERESSRVEEGRRKSEEERGKKESEEERKKKESEEDREEERKEEEEEEEEEDPANLPVSHLRQRFEEQMRLQQQEAGRKGNDDVRKKKMMTSGSLKARLELFEDKGKEKDPLPLWKPKIKVRRYFDANEFEGSISAASSRNPSTDLPFAGDESSNHNHENNGLPPLLDSPSPDDQEVNGIILRPESPSSSSSSDEDADVYFESMEEIPSTPVTQTSTGEESEVPLIPEAIPKSELTHPSEVLSTPDPETCSLESSILDAPSHSDNSEATVHPAEPRGATSEDLPVSPALEMESVETHPGEAEELANVAESEPPSMETSSTLESQAEKQEESNGNEEPSRKRESEEMAGTDSKLDENEAPWLADSLGGSRERKKRVPAEGGQPRWDTTLSMSFDPTTLFSSSPPRASAGQEETPVEPSFTSPRTSTFNYADFSVRYQFEKKAMKQPEDWILLDEEDLPAVKARPRVTTQHHRSATMISDDISFVGKVGNLVASQLTQQERMRQEAIFELIFSEQCFRDDMKRVLEVYMEPLKKENILSPKELNKMFLNLPDLYDFSCVFSAALIKRQDEDNFVVKRIGNVISQFVGGMIIFGPYTRNYSSVVQDFQDRLEWHEEFVEFIGKCRAEADPPMEMDLKGNLIKPLQRLTKMPLLVSAILKHTPSDHEDYEDLLQASELIQQVVTEVNQCT